MPCRYEIIDAMFTFKDAEKLESTAVVPEYVQVPVDVGYSSLDSLWLTSQLFLVMIFYLFVDVIEIIIS